MPVPERAPPADLPDDLLELAVERLLAAAPGARAQTLDDLVREHPELEAPLRRFAGDLAGAELLLATGFAAPAEQMTAIGPYRVLALIGEGAFGVVYRCAQERPVRREVAVKVLRPGAGDRHTLARFEAERHVLASLSHPAIALVFDAGVLPDGRPWFVMEYVAGVPITSYCDRHCLGVDARLGLFVRLCEGAQHAHGNGIVHRDLKPGNVLVYEQDGRPQPKIIDFGIAKALHATEGATTPRTETGRVIGTPGYMSPEQQTAAELDARADVFSLGVMLYELLTGELPWGRRPESTDSEPPRPSARVATDPTGDAARARAIPVRKLASRLRGDLDWIVLKAIARERERRYGSARELADDLARHLRGEPVHAGPPALGYRLRKFVRRRRGVLFAAGAVVIAVALGLWASVNFRAEARARTADLDAAAARLLARVNDRSVVDAPRSAGLRKALVEEAVAFYEQFLRGRPDDPELRAGRARALMTLAQVHWALGQWQESAAIAREATVEAEGLLAATPDDVAVRGLLGNARRNLGRALFDQGQFQAARAELERAVADLDRCHAQAPAEHSHSLGRALMEWATTLRGSDEEARAPALRRAVAIQETAVAQHPSTVARLDLLDALTSLGQLLTRRGELLEARQVLRRADELLAATPEAGWQYACSVLSAGAELAGREGDHGAAVACLQEAIAAAQKWCEREPEWSRPWEEHFDLYTALAMAQHAAGDPQGATETTRAAIALGDQRLVRFPGDRIAGGQLADVLTTFARERLDHGRRSLLAEAEECGRRAVTLFAALPETVDLRVRTHARLLALCNLSQVLDARGSAQAPDHWQETAQALAAWRERFGVGDADATMFVETELRLARHRVGDGDGDGDGAAAILDGVEALLRAHAPAIALVPRRTAETHRLRALLAARRGDDQDAAAQGEQALAAGAGWRGFLAAAEGARAAWQAARAGDHAARARAAGHRDRAIDLHRAAIDALETALTGSPDDPRATVPLGQARVRLAGLLLDRGEGDLARQLLEEALPDLEAGRDEVHADVWDEALFAEGKALAAR